MIRKTFQQIYRSAADNIIKPQKNKNKGYLAQRIIQSNKLKPKLLPPSQDKDRVTVVMQLDQVLSYTFVPDQEGYLLAPRRKQDFHLWFQQYESLLNIYKRKNLENFLNYLSQQCEPVVWSTGVPAYVNLVMSLIDPQRKIKHIFTQEQCDRIVQQSGDIDEFVKDLGLLGRDMSKVIYIDTKPLSFWLYPENGLCWQQFRADNTMRSQDLDEIILEIQACRRQKDVRIYLQKQYTLAQDFKHAQLI